MKIEIRNIDLAKTISFLEQLNFKGIASINRSKITNHLSKKLQEVIEGEKVIREDGKDKPNQWLDNELRNYFKEKVVVEGNEFLKPLKVVKSKIKELTSEDSEEEFNGEDAYVLSLLYDEFHLGSDE